MISDELNNQAKRMTIATTKTIKILEELKFSDDEVVNFLAGFPVVVSKTLPQKDRGAFYLNLLTTLRRMIKNGE